MLRQWWLLIAPSAALFVITCRPAEGDGGSGSAAAARISVELQHTMFVRLTLPLFAFTYA